MDEQSSVDLIQIEDPSADPEFLRAMEYISMRELRYKMSKDEIADFFGITRVTLDSWIRKWSESGLLQQCRRQYITQTHVEEARQGIAAVLLNSHGVFTELIELALHSHSPKVRSDTGQYLVEQIIKPYLEKYEMADSTEAMDYIKSVENIEQALNPMSISDDD